MSLVNAIIDQNQYVLAPSLQMFFINPDNCQPLSSGVITFYSDTDRTLYKPVYRIGGTPTEPTFTALPNPVTLDMCGIFIDNNNGDAVLPYYNVLDEDGNADLYYITIADSLGNIIETLEHFPSVNVNTSPTITQVENFINNGQFLEHLNLPNNGLIPSANTVTGVAYGGWTFVQTPNSTSINRVTFPRYNAPLDFPVQNPRYACNVICTFANPADQYKDLTYTINDVNFMQGQPMTFQITAYSNDGSTHNVNFNIKKFFGVGGSSTTYNTIYTFTVTPQIQDFNIPFIMSSNLTSEIGPNDDDYVALILQGPLPSVSNILYTDAILVQGTAPILSYPPTTPAQEKAATLPGSFSIPAYDGSDSGKFPQLNVKTDGSLGFIYSDPTPPGTHIWSVSKTAPQGYVYEDGSSYAVEKDAKTTVTAYPDLFAAILTSSLSGSYSYGSGQNGFTNIYSSTGVMYHRWNRNDVGQPTPNYDAGTSGFNFVQGTSVGFSTATITTVAGSAMTAGSYYRLFVNTSGPQFIQMFYFTIDGVGTEPNSITYDVAVKIAILSTDTADQVAVKLVKYANGLFQVPNMKGQFARGWTNDSGTDPDANSRTASGNNSGNIGNNIGSYQGWQIQSHNHHITYAGSPHNSGSPDNATGTPGTTDIGTNTGSLPDFTDSTGGSQTNPVNIYFAGYIKT